MAFKKNVTTLDYKEVASILQEAAKANYQGRTIQYPPSFIEKGDIFVYTLDSKQYIDYRSDTFQWRATGTKYSKEHYVVKKHYKLQLSEKSVYSRECL